MGKNTVFGNTSVIAIISGDFSATKLFSSESFVCVKQSQFVYKTCNLSKFKILW